jgi:hypothetical protein
MDAELLALCNQTVTRYAYVGYDDHNDFTWQTDITNQDVVLTGVIASIVLSPANGKLIMAGMTVKDSATGLITYGLGIDYTIDYTAGTIVRTVTSTIPTGATVHVSYSWQTVTTFKARVEYSNKLIRDKNGQEIIATCQVYCDGSTVIIEQDKIVISGTSRADPEILVIQCNPDETGAIDHKVIFTR